MPTHYQGTPTETQALDAYIKLSRAAESVNQRINEHLHARGLTVSQFGVLEALYHLGPLPVGQLAGKILRSSANLTLVVDNLARQGTWRGWCGRSPPCRPTSRPRWPSCAASWARLNSTTATRPDR